MFLDQDIQIEMIIVLDYFRVKFYKKVQVGSDQEKAQSESDSHSKKPRWENPNQQSGTYTMTTYNKPNEQLFFK